MGIFCRLVCRKNSSLSTPPTPQPTSARDFSNYFPYKATYSFTTCFYLSTIQDVPNNKSVLLITCQSCLLQRIFYLIIKFDITHTVFCWNSLLYQSIEPKARELKLSRHLPNCIMSGHFLDFSLAHFINWNWYFGTSKLANGNTGTKKGL